MPSKTNPRLKYGVEEEGADPHSAFGLLATPIVRAALALWRALADAWRAGIERMEQRRQRPKSTGIF